MNVPVRGGFLQTRVSRRGFTGFMSVFKDRRSDSPFLFPSSSVERFDIAKILRFKATDDSFLCYSSYHNYILTTSSCSTV